MTKRTIYRTSMFALATMFCGPAFAYSNVSPKEAPQKVTSMHQSPAFDDAPVRRMTPDNYRYHGGPKSTSERPANDPFASMLLG